VQARLHAFARAWRALAIAKLGLAFWPYKKLDAWMRRRIRPIRVHLDPAQIGWAINKAAAFFPGGASCLPRALAAQWLLAQAGHDARLRIGVTNDEKFEAHAWVVSSGEIVVGGTVETLARYNLLTESHLSL
jgi:hypothetical protein